MEDGLRHEVRTFATTTSALMELGAWLTEQGCTHAVLESTGVYWKPVWHVAQGSGDPDRADRRRHRVASFSSAVATMVGSARAVRVAAREARAAMMKAMQLLGLGLALTACNGDDEPGGARAARAAAEWEARSRAVART